MIRALADPGGAWALSPSSVRRLPRDLVAGPRAAAVCAPALATHEAAAPSAQPDPQGRKSIDSQDHRGGIAGRALLYDKAATSTMRW